MGEETQAPASPESEVKEPEVKEDNSLLSKPEQEVPEKGAEKKEEKPEEKKEDLLSEADKEAIKVKEADDKKLLEKDDKDLSEEEKTKKDALIKAQNDVKVKEEADKKAKEVPEKYEFTIPEGMTLDQALVDKVSPVFKELKISQADAQKLVGVYADHIKAMGDADEKNFDTFVADSKRETIKELGAEYKKELSYAAKTRGRLLSPETIVLLNASGISNNVHFIKDLIKIGRSISEDIAVGGTSESGGGKTDAERMYPNQGKT